MRYRPSMVPSCMAVIVLVCGCSDSHSDSETLKRSTEIQFHSATIAGVTTDHASTGGASWIDHDGDGDIDLFVTNGYDVSAENPVGQPNRLYRNDGQAGFFAITTGALIGGDAKSSANTWADYDNDGDLDVFIANQQDQNNQLFRNEGNGTFVAIDDEAPATDGGHSYTAAWVDVDQDGWLDLFVANGGMSHVGRNGLYRNTGDGHFESIATGSIVTDEAATCGIAWGDYDNDGDPDLFVANQGFAPPANNNALYRNDGNWSFSRIENLPQVTDGQPSCAATWVDVDNDLDLDLHVTSMYGMADLLYLNDGGGGLTPGPESPLTVDAGHSYGASWADLDNDGDIDVVVANWGAAPAVYRNDGSGFFTRVRPGDLGRKSEYAGAIAAADYDGDGAVDVFIGNWPNGPGPEETNTLYRNLSTGGHWLRIRLVGTTSNRSGVGAQIRITLDRGDGACAQMREVTTQMGFRGQGDLLPHFGLGKAAGVDALEVLWPSGKISKLADIAANQTVEIVEP